ncbi:MAG: DNA-directed RNA polymerase subunit H [Methanosarcinales archaeon]|uniref:DNA-directed RNA polymerase subunit Rpo5 n=1 Tax=Candidatus Ethanoperedens thermophilum TaxID=2766897 RepID=A0A848D9V3_9EURY|nr:DNA-directed RNA polymerase subunit H [Candidatus Ethanoperedens thermophilum]
MKEFSLLNHDTVPNHEILSDEELALVLEKYNIEKEQLPKIKTVDPVIKEIKAGAGNVIKVTRKSATAGEATIYRLVV